MINWVRISHILKVTFSIICIELLLFSSVGLQSSTSPKNTIAKIQQQAFAQSLLPTQGTECDPNAETLEFMSKGPLVERVQNLLIERGFNTRGG